MWTQKCKPIGINRREWIFKRNNLIKKFQSRLIIIHLKIMLSDWLKCHRWLTTSNQSALFQRRVVTLVLKIFKRLPPGPCPFILSTRGPQTLRCEPNPNSWRFVCSQAWYFSNWMIALINACTPFPMGTKFVKKKVFCHPNSYLFSICQRCFSSLGRISNSWRAPNGAYIFPSSYWPYLFDPSNRKQYLDTLK